MAYISNPRKLLTTSEAGGLATTIADNSAKNAFRDAKFLAAIVAAIGGVAAAGINAHSAKNATYNNKVGDYKASRQIAEMEYKKALATIPEDKLKTMSQSEKDEYVLKYLRRKNKIDAEIAKSRSATNEAAEECNYIKVLDFFAEQGVYLNQNDIQALRERFSEDDKDRLTDIGANIGGDVAFAGANVIRGLLARDVDKHAVEDGKVGSARADIKIKRMMEKEEERDRRKAEREAKKEARNKKIYRMLSN